MEQNESKGIVKGAFILALAGIISKVLSAGYRIPLQNLTGDIGFYIYQQVYPLLGIAIVLALYGFPSAISQLTADIKAGGGQLAWQNFYGPLFFILFMISGICFLLLYSGAHTLANVVGDSKLAVTYQRAAFVFLLIPFTALFRGVFQGMQQMKPTAYSQIGEQILRVIIIILAAILITRTGTDIYTIGEAASLASIAGAIIAIIILGFFFVKEHRMKRVERVGVPWKKYIQTVFLFGVAAALNHMILLIIQLADAFTIVPGLMEYGLTKFDAMQEKGIFDRGQPLIQLGTVLGSSFALAVIPNLPKKQMQNSTKGNYESIQGAVAISFYLAAGAAIGLIMIFPETNVLLYQDLSGTAALRILSLAVFLSAVTITATSILQGIGYIRRTAGFILAAFLIKWGANILLVPVLDIAGSAVATVLSLLALVSVVIIELKKKLPELVLFRKVSWQALLQAGFVMAGYIMIISYVLPAPLASRSVLLFYVSFVAVTGACFYVVTLLRSGAFTEKELAMLPFAHLLIRIHKEKK